MHGIGEAIVKSEEIAVRRKQDKAGRVPLSGSLRQSRTPRQQPRRLESAGFNSCMFSRRASRPTGTTVPYARRSVTWWALGFSAKRRNSLPGQRVTAKSKKPH